MPTLHEVAYALFGAYRLALMDPGGLGYFDRSREAALRSFFAALLVLPAYALLVGSRLEAAGISAPLPGVMLVEGIAFIISTTAFPLVMSDVARFLERNDRYPLFVSVYNWTAVLQMLVYVPAILIGESGLLPPEIGDLLVFAATMIVLAYQWFATQVALELPGFTAAGLVILDLVLSVFISGAADGML